MHHNRAHLKQQASEPTSLVNRHIGEYQFQSMSNSPEPVAASRSLAEVGLSLFAIISKRSKPMATRMAAFSMGWKTKIWMRSRGLSSTALSLREADKSCGRSALSLDTSLDCSIFGAMLSTWLAN